MTTVSSLASVTAQDTSQQIQTVGKSKLDRNDFMNLLITQMQYQDPLQPMQSSDMASQLAQFSNMEATMEMADNVEQLLNYQKSQNNLQLLTLLGKEVSSTANMVAVNNGEPSSATFSLAGAADSCSVTIKDASGNVVRTMNLGGLAGDTTYQLSWDGTTNAGTKVDDGPYQFVVSAQDATGKDVDVEYRSSGTVTGVDFSSGTATLTMDNYLPVDVSVITSVADGTTSTTSSSTATGTDG